MRSPGPTESLTRLAPRTSAWGARQPPLVVCKDGSFEGSQSAGRARVGGYCLDPVDGQELFFGLGAPEELIRQFVGSQGEQAIAQMDLLAVAVFAAALLPRLLGKRAFFCIDNGGVRATPTFPPGHMGCNSCCWG